MTPATGGRCIGLNDFGGSVEMPLNANRGGDGGRSGSSLLSVLNAENGIAGHEGVSPPAAELLMLLIGNNIFIRAHAMGHYYTRHTGVEIAVL